MKRLTLGVYSTVDVTIFYIKYRKERSTKSIAIEGVQMLRIT